MASQPNIPRSVAPGVGFGATANFLSRFGPVQQVLKVARVATWNLQWQVKGLVSARPGIDARTLTGRFVDGSDVEGIDLKKTVANTAWEVLDQEIDRLLLTNIIALYESWCHELTAVFAGHELISDSEHRTIRDGLQWPEAYPGRTRPGILSALASLNSAGGFSAGMKALLETTQPSPVDTARLSERLKIYRTFKEARNSVAHQGAIASAYLCEVYDNGRNITSQSLGMRIVPEFLAPSFGMPVSLTWNGVIGLADMLRRSVVDVDHYLMFTNAALLDLAERLRSDPIAVDDPTCVGQLIKRREWAKIPNGPFVVIGNRQHRRKGQKVVNHAISRLLNLPTSQEDRIFSIWPELVANRAVEERANLRDI